MDFGAHLPLIDFDDSRYSLDGLIAYAAAARDLGFAAMAANDHLLFARPWLDGPTALAAVLGQSGSMDLMTTLALPVIRGPVQTAKLLAAIDLLSGGRLIAGVGPGSSRADYEAVGLDFEERWPRFDDAVATLRALWQGSSHRGQFYFSEGIAPTPAPFRAAGPPIWIGSWGSAAGLRRTARLGDGWLASAYNTTPADFEAAWLRLKGLLESAGKPASEFPNALSTMWTFISEDRNEARRMLEDVLAKMLNRDPAALGPLVTIGPAEECAEKLRAYAAAGVQRVLIWPIASPLRQLELFKTSVEPLIS